MVPGDIVELSVGDKIPADIRLLYFKTATLRAEQSSLTGESVPVLKRLEPVLDEDCELQLKECMVFAGTAITNGSSTGVVTTIGMSTEIGKIQSQIQQASDEESDTPLKQKLDAFGELLAKVKVVYCLDLWLNSGARLFGKKGSGSQEDHNYGSKNIIDDNQHGFLSA